MQLKKVFFLREALTAYSDGIDAKPEDKKLLGVLLSNRSQAQLVLGNNRSALEDAKSAVQQDPSIPKVHCPPIPTRFEGLIMTSQAAVFACKLPCGARLENELLHLGLWLHRGSLQVSNAVQAYFRGARAALRLHEYAAAVQLAQDGLKVDSSIAELKQMLQVQKIFTSWTACTWMERKEVALETMETRSILHGSFT